MMEKKELERKLNEVDVVAKEIAMEIRRKLYVNVRNSNSTEKIILDFLVFDDKNDYIKVYIEYDKNKTVKDYVKDILEDLQNEEYTYYQADKMERDINSYLSGTGIRVYEGDIFVNGEAISILDIEDYKIDERTLHLIWSDEECLITFGGFETIIEWFDKDEYEKMKQEERKYNQVIEELKEVINALKAEDKKKKDIETAKCLERLINKGMLEKSKELNKDFERFRIINEIRF